ncbi:hypothetical protein [Myxococcus sp. AB025B]|uniref:hypothetical protein n=1 Tax=Myxococcus sp. AB025B TaxID=2562794 RepID=UPI0011435AA1|nr:hypothetical protein [Myxococcus sp. AB025B]
MKTSKKLMMCVLFVGALTGCRTLGSRPTPSPSCPEVAPLPKVPTIQALPPNAELPEGATQVVVGLCRRTGQYLALGVAPEQGRFAYAVAGSRGTSDAFFARVQRLGLPMTVFSAPVKLRKGGSVGSSAVDTSSDPQQGNPQEDKDPTEGPTYDPCINQQDEIGDKPPPDPTDEGGAAPTVPSSFASLAWQTASAIDAASDPAPEKPDTTSPTGSTVPR